MNHSSHVGPDSEYVGKRLAGTVRIVGLAVFLIGLGLSIAAYLTDPDRFSRGYLVGFLWALTLALGGLAFVMLQHLTKAGWSVAPRRSAEWLASALQWSWVLAIPLIFLAGRAFSLWMGVHWQGDKDLAAKHGYLNVPFFAVRAVGYFALWFFLARVFVKTSRKQDETGDPSLTTKMQVWSAPAAYFFAFSITFAAFDWLMSTDPYWFSTIFGMYVISGCIVSGVAAIALMQIGFQRARVMSRVSSIEHRHDLGKLLFGFTIFWAYMAFVQFFLIWYSNIPAETEWYTHRWFTEAGLHSGWMPWSLALMVLQFWVPFFLLLSRFPKRSYFGLTLGAIVVLVAHYIDIYWIVMPNFYTAGHFSWMDLGGVFVPAGALVTWLGVRAARDPVFPLKDPRLHEAMSLVNL